MISIKPITLTGDKVTLKPLSSDHEAELCTTVEDGALYNLWYTLVPTPQQMATEIARRLRLAAEGSMLPFTVFNNTTGKAIGATTYLNIDNKNRRLEIGATWYQKSSQRSGVNTECKRLLLTHAFETLDCIAVEFRTHFMNHASRRAIERLGAKLDGILRNHIIMPDGTLRDTCVYSITASEWPMVKAHLGWLSRRYS